MKLTNTRYGFIENEQGIHEFKEVTINWRNCFIYACVWGIVIYALVSWYV